MKKILITVFVALLSLCVNAQKEDLKKLCSDYEQLILAEKTFHLPYRLTVASALDTTVEHMNFDLYKSNNKDQLKMGESQIIIHDGTLLLVVNHEVRTIRLSNDSMNVTAKNVLISDFTSIIDSSSNVQLASKDGLLTYTLSFPKDYGYSNLQIVFSKKTKHLKQIYAAFSESYASEFKYIEVDYQEPDFKWVPQADFPGTSTYVTQANGHYMIQDAFDSYKTY